MSAQVDGERVVLRGKRAGERFVHATTEAGGVADEEWFAFAAEIVHGDHVIRTVAFIGSSPTSSK